MVAKEPFMRFAQMGKGKKLLCVVINVLTDVNCQLQPIFWLIFAPCYSINSIADSRQKKPVSIISNPFVYSKVLYVLAVMMLRTNG